MTDKFSRSLFLINVTAGKEPSYERKAEWGPLKWGDAVIPINGYISNIPPDESPLGNQTVRIRGTQNDALIFERTVSTAGTGFYNTSFYPPTDGTVTIDATLIYAGKNSTARALITVIATQAWMPAILITLFITASVATMVIFLIISKGKGTNEKQWVKAGVIPAVIFNIFAYIVLYKFPPFEAGGNAALAAALIAPMAAYIYEALKS